jgi:hypothetical protein
MAKLYWDVEQGSAAWYKLRSGIPTASEFHLCITPKKLEVSASRKRYLSRLVCERLLNWQADSLDKIDHIAEGKANEPFAIAQLEEIYEIETRRLGFATTDDGRFGASPDRVVTHGDAIAITVESKAPTIPVQMERLLFGNGEEYRLQVMGQLWIAEADKAIYYSYNPRLPAYKAEFGRDEATIKKIAACMEQVSDELEALTEKAKGLGLFQAFPDLVLPVEAEYADRFRPPPEAELQAILDMPRDQSYE